MAKSGSQEVGNSVRRARLMRRASSSPERISTSIPHRSRTASQNASELTASRTAQVATTHLVHAPFEEQLSAWNWRRAIVRFERSGIGGFGGVPLIHFRVE